MREEAFILAATRRKKADDYKANKLAKQIQEKDDRSSAIKEGYETLSKMRNTMKVCTHALTHSYSLTHTHSLIHTHPLTHSPTHPLTW